MVQLWFLATGLRAVAAYGLVKESLYDRRSLRREVAVETVEQPRQLAEKTSSQPIWG